MKNENLKKCANPNCINDPFSAKSSKKKFCDIYCKNQAAYIYRKLNYPWYEIIVRSLKKNITILEYLYTRGTLNILHEELVKMGFNFDATLIPYIDPIKGSVFRYDRLALRQISKTDYEILKFNCNVTN